MIKVNENEKLVEKIMREFSNKDEHPSEWLKESLLRMAEKKDNDWNKIWYRRELTLANKVAELKDERDKTIAGSNDLLNRFAKLKTENAKLKADLKENHQISDRISTLILERDEAKAENEKLKSMLNSISEHPERVVKKLKKEVKS